jgi:hypothetical protein
MGADEINGIVPVGGMVPFTDHNNIIIKQDTDIFDFLEHSKRPFLELRKLETNPKFIKEFVGKGNKSFKYIDRNTACLYLDMLTSEWDWVFDISTFKRERNQYYGTGTLTVVFNNFERVITTVGAVDIRKKDGVEVDMDYVKSVDSDALKRACSTLGLFHDVYSDVDINEPIKKQDNSELESFYITEIMDDAIANMTHEQVFSQIKLLLNGELTMNDMKDLSAFLKGI